MQNGYRGVLQQHRQRRDNGIERAHAEAAQHPLASPSVLAWRALVLLRLHVVAGHLFVGGAIFHAIAAHQHSVGSVRNRCRYWGLLRQGHRTRHRGDGEHQRNRNGDPGSWVVISHPHGV